MFHTFSGCSCLKNILINCGYDNTASLKCIIPDHLLEIDEYVDQNRHVISSLNCAHSKIYEAQGKFRLLPGHRSYILKWIQTQNETTDITKHQSQVDKNLIRIDNPAFSPIMMELIRSALENHSRSPNARRFSEMLMNFSIHVYIMAGRACYEMISANIPIPKATTICEYFKTIAASFAVTIDYQ